MKFKKQDLSKSQLRNLYKAMLYPRMIEEKMLLLLRQGKISKWFSGIGQEAIAVGVSAALEPDEFIFPMHRNLGVFTSRFVPLEKLFAQWQGKKGGFTKGRDRSFHFGSLEHHIVGMISHLGPQLSLACGVALAHQLNADPKVVLAFTGEGGTSEGEFHEALNLAAVWSLPVIFLIENNGYALSTPTNEQYACATLADRGIGYGIESVTIDGNNILKVYHTIDQYAQQIRNNPKPVIVECMTFRMRGHEEASGTKYVPKEVMEHWAKRDPVNTFEAYLHKKEILRPEQTDQIKSDFRDDINQRIQESMSYPDVEVDATLELEDVYAHDHPKPSQVDYHESLSMRFVDAIQDGLRLAMQQHPKLIIMGQDVAEYGGVFKITEGFVEQFGKDRVRNTPLCESAVIGAALGLTFEGYHAVVEMQFADFVTCGFNQIVNNLAKTHYRWGHSVNAVIRMPTGGNVGAGPFHSQSTESWFMHCPGLKIVYPSNPVDAKGLLISAIDDPNPILYFEHKYLYRTQKTEVPKKAFTVPIGKANLVQEGNDVSIITYGLGVIWAQEAVAELNISADIVDLRTLLPYDKEMIIASVQKCNKVLVLSESTEIGGICSEIAAFIQETCFSDLDAPVVRCSSLPTPVPFAKSLEKRYLANHNLLNKLTFLLKY